MPERTCSIEDCDSPSRKRGWCNRHYEQNRSAGVLADLPTCSIDGCDRTVAARGWCRPHWKRWHRHGDPNATRPNITPNRTVLNGSNSKLIITRSDGSECATWFDARDAEIVKGHQWHLAAGYVTTDLPRSNGQRGKAVSLHRAILGLDAGDGLFGDHIDGDTANNRRSNLRITDKAGNGANRAVISNRGASKYRGVYWRREQPHWRARFGPFHIGYYLTEEQAAAAVAAFKAKQGIVLGY